MDSLIRTEMRGVAGKLRLFTEDGLLGAVKRYVQKGVSSAIEGALLLAPAATAAAAAAVVTAATTAGAEPPPPLLLLLLLLLLLPR